MNKFKPKTREELELEFKERINDTIVDKHLLCGVYTFQDGETKSISVLEDHLNKLKELFYSVLKRVDR
jgi:hypothetical protein